MNDFERGKDPKEAMNIGKIPKIKRLYEKFQGHLKAAWPDLYLMGMTLNTAEEYIEFNLDYYSEQEMNMLDEKIWNVIRIIYNGRLVIVDNYYWTHYIGVENMPDDSPFYDEESIYVKILKWNSKET